MRSLLRLSADRWIRDLASGKLRLGVEFPSLSTFDSSWGHHDRTIDAGILYLVIDGGIRATVGKTRLEVREGSLFLLGPGVRHSLTMLGDRRLTLYHMRLRPVIHGRPAWLQDETQCHPHVLDLRPYLETLIQDAAEQAPWGEERMRAVFLLLFSGIFKSAMAVGGPGLTANQQALLSGFVRKRSGARIAPRDLADAVGLSHGYFSKLFKLSYRSAPRAWLVRERLRLASLVLLESSASITEVAYQFGYNNAFLFSRQFAQEHGCSPRAFRQKHS